MTHAFSDVVFLEKQNLKEGDMFYDKEFNRFFIITSVRRSAAGLFYFTIYIINDMKYERLPGSLLASMWEHNIVEKQ